VIGIILALVGTCAVRPARCSCFPPPEPSTAAEARAYVERADEAFVGRVIRTIAAEPRLNRSTAERESWDHIAVTLVVTSRWRGVRADTVVVNTSSLGEMCGMDFLPGTEYFVMASRKLAGPPPQSERLQVWTCGQSRLADRSRKLLALLGSPVPR
jgi:hypothetical protein